MRAITNAPAEGVYENVPFSEYVKWDALSHSELKEFMKAPAKYKALKMQPKEPTKDMILGSAVHTLLLERERFGLEYAVAPSVDRRTKAGKLEWAEFTANNSSKTVLKKEEKHIAEMIRIGIEKHPAAAAIIDSSTNKELSIIWRHPTGVLCKSRLDLYNEKLKSIFDIKTTVDASPYPFERSLYNYNYYTAAYFYLQAAKAAGLEVDTFGFIAVEKEFPYLCAVYELDASVIEAGQEDVEKAILNFNACKTTDRWPGYSNDVQKLCLPGWALQRIGE